MNELLLAASVIVLYGGVIVFYRLLGKAGLYGFTVFATILANIEVLIIVKAFGMEMTLGNVLFACTFLITDVLSENHGRAAANRSVLLGVLTSLLFVIVSQSWLLYSPAESDWASPSFGVLFANTPRLIMASLVVYAVTQAGDVWLYHRWWAATEKRLGNKRSALWLRNNGSTLISQFFNATLYNVLAFAGMYSAETLVSIVISTYAIYIVTSLLDTPVVYICRRIREAGHDAAFLREADETTAAAAQ